MSRGRGERCHYCRRTLEASKSKGKLAATRDHTRPSWIGGEHTVWCCRFCNSLKGPVEMWTWLRFIAANDGYWRKDKVDVCHEFRKKNHNISWRQLWDDTVAEVDEMERQRGW